MAKLTLTDLANLNNPTTAVTAINANNALIETALENTLSLDGTTPNSMNAHLDMNGHNIINIGEGGLTESNLAVGGAWDQNSSSGLSYHMFPMNYDGPAGPADHISTQPVTLTDNATNFVEVDNGGLVLANTSAFTPGNFALAIVTTENGEITNNNDKRSFAKFNGMGLHYLTEDYTVADQESGRTYCIEPNAVVSLITVDLTTNVSSGSWLKHEFIVTKSTGLKILAGASSKIRIGGTTTVTGGHISSTTVGTAVTLYGILLVAGAWDWFAISSTGSWTFDA